MEWAYGLWTPVIHGQPSGAVIIAGPIRDLSIAVKFCTTLVKNCGQPCAKFHPDPEQLKKKENVMDTGPDELFHFHHSPHGHTQWDGGAFLLQEIAAQNQLEKTNGVSTACHVLNIYTTDHYKRVKRHL